jgi:hypothetical protein
VTTLVQLVVAQVGGDRHALERVSAPFSASVASSKRKYRLTAGQSRPSISV